MENLGKANVRVQLLDSLPFITRTDRLFTFDLVSDSWPMLQQSQHLKPVFLDYIEGELGEWSAIIPEKRTFYVDNYMKKADGTSATVADKPSIEWTATDMVVGQGVIEDIITGSGENTKFPSYTLIQPDEYPTTDGAYNGPEWKNSAEDRPAPPDDISLIRKLSNWFRNYDPTTTTTTTEITNTTTTPGETPTTDTGVIPNVSYVYQRKVKDGLWWGIESSDFLYENMPFWVRIGRMSPPSSEKYETFIVISLGIDSQADQYDLYLANGKKPMLIDYYKGRDYSGASYTPSSEGATATATAASGSPYIVKSFENESAKIIDGESDLEIGFMTVGARLIIIINGHQLIYSRIDQSKVKSETSEKNKNLTLAEAQKVKKAENEEEGSLKEAKIAPGKIRIYGSNSIAKINVSPMTFVPVGLFAASVKAYSGVGTTTHSNRYREYFNVQKDGSIGGSSVVVLPNDSTSNITQYGCDCEVFRDQSGRDAYPDGFGFHQQGKIKWARAASLTSYSGRDDLSFYLVIMYSEDLLWAVNGRIFALSSGGAPYFFRIKGGVKIESDTQPFSSEDISDDVISVSEASKSPDLFSVENSATITLYNKGGEYDYLKANMMGVSIEYAWSGNSFKKTFTGIVVRTTTNETPGRETMTLTCEDYMHILKARPIINSPFYDGMITFYACKDLAERAGITEIVNDWGDTEEYFLPSGYSFTKPVMRYPNEQKIFDCIMDMVQRAVAVIYFDEFGRLHFKKVPGGLYSDSSAEPVVARFTRDPDGINGGLNVILDEKAEDYQLQDTFNRMTITTVDRNTRNAIIIAKGADNIGIKDRLLFQKPFFLDQPAYGSLATATVVLYEMGKRLMSPYRAISFKTVGQASLIRPLDFIEVDGSEFRLMSISRDYSADDNSFTSTYECKWVGGIP